MKETDYEWAQQMLDTPINKTPAILMSFIRAYRIPLCTDILIYSFCVYAQCVLGLKRGQGNYKADFLDTEWFRLNPW